jgi:hypothetical protein
LGGEAALAKMGVAFDSGMPGFGDMLSQGDIDGALLQNSRLEGFTSRIHAVGRVA